MVISEIPINRNKLQTIHDKKRDDEQNVRLGYTRRWGIMDIEFIKWKVEKAEGFIIDIFDGDIGIVFNNEMACNAEELNESHNEGINSLLSQRAIEGVNRDSVEKNNNGYIIDSQRSCVVIYKIDEYHSCRRHWSFVNEVSRSWIGTEQAKESALEYIYDQEQ